MGHRQRRRSRSKYSQDGSPSRIPGHRAPPSYRRQPDPETLPHANLRTQHRGCQVPLLVLPHEAAQGQEVQRRDRLPERHPREATPQGQELWHLDPLRLRSGTHNMYKEYREMSRTDAAEALYQDMAARHRARFRSIHILKVVEITNQNDVKRPYIKQLISKNLKF